MHEVEERVTVPRRARLETVQRDFIAIYNSIFILISEDFAASARPPRNDKRPYQLFCSAKLQEDRQLIPRLDNAQNVSPEAMDIAVAKSLKPLFSKRNVFLLRQSLTRKAMMVKEVDRTRSNHCATDEGKLLTAARL